MNSKIQSIEALLIAYNQTKIMYEQNLIDENIPPINKLLTDFSQMKQAYLQWNKNNAEKYNIFDVLNIRFRETKTHTPFLVNLLNPNDSHAQGMLFFNLFIQHVSPEIKNRLFNNLTASNIEVREEKRTDEGQLDILIRSRGVEKPFAIVIENKINADDQPKQLSRYYNYCKSLGLGDEQILLVYLTKDGKPASENSMPLKEQERLYASSSLVNISYRKHIKKILEIFISNAKAESVKLIASQYLNTIKHF